MASEIKDLFGSSTALTITLANLASSTTGVGRQSDIVDNTTTRWGLIKVFVKVKLGTSPAGAGAGAYVYLISCDANASPHYSDGAGASDAALTVLNAAFIGAIRAQNSPSTGDSLYGEFLVPHPGPKWGIAIVQDTGVNLDSTAGNHWVRYVGIDPEAQ